VGGIQGLRDAQAFATQMDAADSLYFLEPHDSFLTQSNISVTYYDGHHRIKTIGTEFQDNRIKVIEAVGGIITTIIPFVGLAPPTTKEDNIELPLVFDFASLDRFEVHDTYSNWENIPNHTKWWYRYKISQPQGRVFKTEEYFKKREGKYTREFPISACVDLTLEIGKGSNSNEAENTRATYVVSVPDPSFVEPLPFPRKGSIAMHTVCGADITTQPSQTADTFSILESIAKQVEAIWKAQPKKAEEEAPKKAGEAPKKSP
jgi:hypothetical protein